MRRPGWFVVATLFVASCAASDEPDVAAVEKNDRPKKCKEHRPDDDHDDDHDEGHGRRHKPKAHGDCTTVTASIGLSGGSVTLPGGGPSLVIPFGALAGDTTITINLVDLPPPTGIGAVGPVYEFLPAGLVFAKPVTVSLPMPNGVTTGQVYWSQISGPGFDPIGGTIAAGRITTQTVHFSLAVIGSPLGTQTLLGTSVDLWISAARVHDQGTDLATQDPSPDCAGHKVEAIVDNGAGGFAHVCGDFAPDMRTFSVPGVPLGGDYMLHTRDPNGKHTLLVGSNSLPDLGRHRGGRPYPTSTSANPLLAARTEITSTAALDLQIDGLGGWNEATATQVGDQIEIFSTEADDWLFNAELLDPPPAGAPSAHLVVPWEESANSEVPALIDASHGDRTFVAKLEQRTSGNGFEYQAMASIAEVTPAVQLVDGGTVTGTATLAPLPAAAPVSVTFDGVAHVTALAATNPAGSTTCAGLCGGFFGVLAQGNDANFGFYTANADLLLLGDTSPTGTLMNTGNMTRAAASSLPGGTWGELAVARWSKFHQVTLPNTAGPGPGSGLADGFDWTTTLDRITGPIVPQIGVPTDIRVNGAPFFGGAASIDADALTPGAQTTITWTAPSGGALYYGINVRRLFVRGDLRTGGELVASVLTPDTSFTFPPGILDPNETYAFVLVGVRSTGTAQDVANLVAAPFKAGLHVATVRVSSGVFGSAAGPPLAPVQHVLDGMHFPTGAAIDGSAIYWTDRYDDWNLAPPVDSALGSVWRAAAPTWTPELISNFEHAPESVVARGNDVYWTSAGIGPDATLWHHDLSTHATTALATEENLRSVVISPTDGHVVYCSDLGTRIIRNGTAPPDTLDFECGHRVTVDDTNAYFSRFSTGPGNTGRVVQIALDGIGGRKELVTSQPQPWDIEASGGFVYWSNLAFQQPFPSSINRVAVDDDTGASVQLLAQGNQVLKIFGVDGPWVYFVLGGRLQRVPADGSGPPENVAFAPGNCPIGDLAAANGRVVWTDACAGGVYVVEP